MCATTPSYCCREVRDFRWTWTAGSCRTRGAEADADAQAESQSLIPTQLSDRLVRNGEAWRRQRYDERARLLKGTLGLIDLFWPGMLLVGWKRTSATSSRARRFGDVLEG